MGENNINKKQQGKETLQNKTNMQWEEIKKEKDNIERNNKHRRRKRLDSIGIWQSTLKQWARQNKEQENLSIENLDKIWPYITIKDFKEGDKIPEIKKELSPNQLQAIHFLFDLNPGPASFSDTKRQKRYWWSNLIRSKIEQTRDLEVEQELFLTPFRVSDSGERLRAQLDDFANNIVSQESGSKDGITCISGIRGSGKSTVLNRIQWCYKQLEPKAQPLFIRFDAGVTFASEQFARNLIWKICDEAIKKFKQPPYHRVGISVLRRAMGHLGRWCETNMAWATTSLLILIILGTSGYLLQRMQDSEPPRTILPAELNAGKPQIYTLDVLYGKHRQRSSWSKIDKTISYVMHVKLLLPVVGNFSVHDLTFPALTFVIMLSFGLSYRLRQLTINKKVWSLIILLAVFLFIVVLKWQDLFSSNIGNIFFKDDSSRIVLLCTLIWYFACLTIMTLPHWWDTYLESQYYRTHAANLENPEKNSVQIPFALSFFTQLLPRLDDRERLSESTLPFLAERTKELLQHYVLAFDRVVVIIDDVDVLPRQKFHELLRLLRPISKVTGVRSVIAVPHFFYQAFTGPFLSDVNSTVADCHVLGDRGLFEEDHGEFGLKKTLKDREFLYRIFKLLKSRLIVGLDIEKNGERLEPNLDEDGWVDRLNLSLPFHAATINLNLVPQDQELDKVHKDFLMEFGLSRRELLRYIERHLTPSRNQNVSGPESKRRLEKALQAYAVNDSLLEFDAKLFGSSHAIPPVDQKQGEVPTHSELAGFEDCAVRFVEVKRF